MTADASDWAIDARLRERLAEDRVQLIGTVRRFQMRMLHVISPR